MRFLRKIIYIVFAVIILCAIFLIIMTLNDYKSPKELVVSKNENSKIDFDTIKILTWNIGYAGLDASMDFFYEGGKKSRQTKAQTKENLRQICAFIAQNNNADAILLQEVDQNSRRTYHIDEFAEIAKTLPQYSSYFTINYNVKFVPLPITNPTGKIVSGLATYMRAQPQKVEQFAYPNKQTLPMRPFLYDRCFVSARYNCANGKQLIIVNTHNSAYDKGNSRNEEMNVLRDFLLAEYNKGNYVIAGGDWNQTPPNYVNKSKTVKHFTPLRINANFMPQEWEWCVSKNSTNRYVDEPYNKQTTSTTILDFFLISPNVNCIQIDAVDLNFANSDHNPVIGIFTFQK